VNANVLSILLVTLSLATGCSKHEKVQSPIYPEYGLSNTNSGSPFLRTYVIGMSREEVRVILGANQLVSSFGRPDQGWLSLVKDDYGLAYLANQFERDRPTLRVEVADIYRRYECTHILMFDRNGILVASELIRDDSIYHGNVSSL
jgi:hypothetical protein